MKKFVLLGLILGAAACGDDPSNSSGIPDACNPLGGQGCLLPWPSATYLADDATSATGFRVALPSTAMPTNVDGVEVDPTPYNRYDGFSPTGPMLVAFPTGVSAAGLPTFDDIDASLAADAPIVVMAIDTGERVPYFAEVDQNVAEVAKRDLIIRPLARLRPATRYVVVVRKAVKAADGGELPSPPAFEALRDGDAFGHPRFEDIAARWPAIFDRLAAEGIAREDMVVAWDFVTSSDDFLRGDLTKMRNEALPLLQDPANLGFTITSTEPNRPGTYRRYRGTYRAPDYLTAGETDASVLRRGPDGLPARDGDREPQFAAIIPSCVATQPLPRPTIVFGHGLFGSAREYLDDGFVIQLAEDNCLIILAGDFIGLTSRQLQLAPLAVNDMNRGIQIAEKLGQSVIDFMALGATARTKLPTAPEFQYQGQPVIDPTKVYYVGGSLGGTMGNTIMAYDPGFKKGVLAVPGGVWSMLFERSAAWFALLGATQGSYEDPEVYQLVVGFLGWIMEPYDPITTAAHVIKEPMFADQPAKDILFWYAIGDCLINNPATEMVAREMGIQVLAPSVKAPWGLTPVAGPLTSGVTIYDEHPTPMPPVTNQPPSEDNGTHSGVNRNGAVMRQVGRFLYDDEAAVECRSGDTVVACDCNPDGGGVCD